jgi:hypothetical protein
MVPLPPVVMMTTAAVMAVKPGRLGARGESHKAEDQCKQY